MQCDFVGSFIEIILRTFFHTNGSGVLALIDDLYLDNLEFK